jgi:hypothetical protein
MPDCDETLMKGGAPLTTSPKAVGFEVGFTTSTLNLYVYFQHHSPKRTRLGWYRRNECESGMVYSV